MPQTHIDPPREYDGYELDDLIVVFINEDGGEGVTVLETTVRALLPDFVGGDPSDLLDEAADELRSGRPGGWRTPDLN